MKTRILGRVRKESGEWIAEAFKEASAFCAARAVTESEVLLRLTAAIEQELPSIAQPWLKGWQRGVSVINCPEAKISLPIDLWYCKLEDQPCPIQAQVFLDSPEAFFEGCLVSPERKQQIFDTVAAGKYGGFHHLPGRYLCVSCEDEGKKTNFRYHYPWELTLLSAYYPLRERDSREIRKKLLMEGRNLTTLFNALCATHAKQLACHIDANLGEQLRIFEFELFR
jgi:hypothetical protein